MNQIVFHCLSKEKNIKTIITSFFQISSGHEVFQFLKFLWLHVKIPEKIKKAKIEICVNSFRL